MGESFSERTYAVPFGRYQPGGDVGPPDNEVLVGREGQRAYFIDLLFRMGRRGAFLVTGHRGIGKTSFVRHCLSVHREEVFERFLNSNVGRAMFWDLLGAAFLGFIVLLALAMTSKLIEVLTLCLNSETVSPLAWILLVPLILICFYPVLFAREVLQETSGAVGVKRRAVFLLQLKAVLCLVLPLLLLYPFLSGMLGKPASLLTSVRAELVSVSALFLLLLGMFHFEYRWIIRPYLRERLGQPAYAGDPKPELKKVRCYQSLARLTLPWVLLKAWLPILTVPVNLGFEKLDHRRVIHAMLAGLREEYRKTFLSWTSGFANLVRLVGLLVLLTLTHFIGNRWFELPDGVSANATFQAPHASKAANLPEPQLYDNVCGPFERAQAGPAAANVVCKLPGGDAFLKILYYNLLQNDLGLEHGSDSLLFRLILPYRKHPWPWNPEAPSPFLREGIHFEVYHLLILGVLFILGRWLLRKLPILPYEDTVRRIDEVMDFLSARTSVTSRTNRWEPVQVFQGWLIDERTRQIDQDPVDPRTVEFLFLQILNDIQSSDIRLGGRRNQLVHLPAPEVTFFFDELDKLGTRVDPTERESSGDAQQAEILHAERKRSLELHRLLADMKNLLSSAPARFIFVGGRNLHDEWLADQGSRQPLLTNIFNAEVYLPSLLTDFGWRHKDKKSLDANIDLYLQQQLARAALVYEDSSRKQILSFHALPIEEASAEMFTPQEPSKPGNQLLKFKDTTDGEQVDKIEGEIFNRDFRQFLTYRSLGNPKRLKELLGSFVRPTHRIVKETAKHGFSCDHVLTFGDTERFRIQLLARIYRHLAQSFEQKLVNRDDKLAISLFHLSDFLFKFHRRAFSWSNLERVDELVHIHRAPDLREILESLVGQWTERFLHPIRNGMYDFRFRSDLLKEVEYISRQSSAEMAAFNFTLDESQALKSSYSTNIAYIKERTGREPLDMVAGLGELHEFDQEYEDARVYYWRSIALLDERIEQIAGELAFSDNKGPADDADKSAVFASFVGSERGKRLNRHFLTWGISRLRLMLQIGMTFELTRNFERAGIEYRNANTLATALRGAFLQDPLAFQRSDGLTGDGTMHPLKHLNILFQPAFAEAWIAEKLTGAVDTGIGLVEKELWTLRSQLPFVRALRPVLAESPVDVKGSNFSLIIAELHGKAGDLYFFKGRQKVTLVGFREMTQGKTVGHEGYLPRAHYHYVVALHEMRRLISYRVRSSPYKLNIWFRDGSPTWESIQTGNWPDFIFRSTGGALNDLAEATLGRVSLYGLFRSFPGSYRPITTGDVKEARDSTVEAFVRWMETQDDRRGFFTFRLPHTPDGSQALRSWLGRWSTRCAVPAKSPYFPLACFDGTDYQDDFTRLIVALQLKMVGAKMLERGGYIEGAAHELLGVCEIITHYLWWLITVRQLQMWNRNREEGPLKILKTYVNLNDSSHWPAYLSQMALYSLQEASRLFQLGRKAEEEPKGAFLIGNQIPVAQLLLTCSLGLAGEHWKQDPALALQLSALLSDWGVEHNSLDRGQLRALLESALVRHSYPMVNRLHGLKVLIDDRLLQEVDDPNIQPWILELQKLTSELDAPMHFTPLHSGVTYALAYCRWRVLQPLTPEDVVKKIRSAAQRDLQTSEEMFTLRRAYYENISDLIYLYDDFNDRQIHLSHGIQMAGAEINALLRFMVTTEAPSS
ncbi:MAG: ATP-binding protein [Acidobacteriota bacterium]